MGEQEKKPTKKWTVELTDNAKPWVEKYPFHAAAQGGDLPKLQQLLQTNDLQLVNSKDDEKWTAAHYASWYGHLAIVEELLKHGMNVDETNGNGSTPLHYAAGTGKLDITKLLLNRGANTQIKDKEGQKPIDLVKQLKPEHSDALTALLNI